MKIKDIKNKVAAKTAKCKAKTNVKCGKAKKVAAVAVALSLMLFAGCHMGEVPTAQRAQTANTDVKFIVEDGGRANFTFGAEFVSLAQANDTSGTETMSNTPSNAPVVDTKPDIDVSMPVKSGAADAITGLIKGVTGGNSDCTDGSCDDGSCVYNP